jgi:hypothetical protein
MMTGGGGPYVYRVVASGGAGPGHHGTSHAIRIAKSGQGFNAVGLGLIALSSAVFRANIGCYQEVNSQ